MTFVNDELFPSLKELSSTAKDGRRRVVRNVFEDAYNYMKSGQLMRQVINRINAVDFNDLVERQHFGRRLKEGAPDAWREPNRRLYEHYKALPSSLYGKVLPDALEEMEPRLAAIAHGSLISSPYHRCWRSSRKRLSNGVGRAGVRHRGSGPLPLGIRIATPLGHTLVILWDNCG